MKFGSLFSGIGGFDLALERAGMNCAWQCENDPKASAVLKRHWPNVENVGDVHDVRRGRVEPVNLICGGFPCQDLSVAGKRAGLAGERSGLWFEFARIIDELEPGWCIIENVPGLLSSNKGRDFAVIVRWLAERGYGVAWRVLDAQYFGLAQRRRRVFIVGHLGDGRAAEVLFEREGMSGNPPTRRQAGKEVAYTLRQGTSSSSGKGEGGLNITLVPHAETFTIRSGKEGGGKGYLGQEQYIELAQPVALDGRNLETHEQSPTLQSKQSGGYSLNYLPMVMAHGQANAEIVSDGSPSLTDNHEAPIVWEMSHANEGYREAGNQSPTLQGRMGTGGNQVPLVGVRRLTPTECERLQGFPDSWTAEQADSSRYRQLGNAVAVPVVEWIAKRVYAIHKHHCK